MKRYLCFFGRIPNDELKNQIGEVDELEDAMLKVEEQRKNEIPNDTDWKLSVGQIYDRIEELLYIKQDSSEGFVWKSHSYKI